ncbi:hypothetical protein BH11PAT4_BH11PAT4_8450 [soil metagenome]
MVECIIWLGIVLGMWGLLVLAAVKGWAGLVVAMVACIVVLHLFPGFTALNTAFVSVMQFRKDLRRQDYYFEALAPAGATDP